MKGLVLNIMKQKIAIYARKSVANEDSISIESQIEMCKYEARGQECVIYQDNGYSGKNVDRPDFQRMMLDVKSGKIEKVIVYKLDRISRSVLDFSELMDVFQKYKVDFVSATEHFDTSSPMGRAMLNICVVFAQLERETIQQRITDAYASRSKKGFYMGGKIPYGYKKVPTTINGIRTSMYEPVPEEVENVKLIYELYSNPSATLGGVLKELTARGLNKNKRGHYWNTARLSETMRNPVYTKNDILVYDFYKQQESNLIDPPEKYDGNSSLYLFAGENTNRKTWDLKGQNIVIAPHSGFVDPEIWIACRKKLLANHQIKTCKAKNSFLASKIKCGNCGYGIVVRFSERKKGHVRYFIDTGWTEHHCCQHKLPTIHADDFEEMIVEKLRNKISSLSIKSKSDITNDFQTSIKSIKIKIAEIDNAIESLVDKITMADIDKTTIMYINNKIAKLDAEKADCVRELDHLIDNQQNDKQEQYNILYDVMSKWEDLSFDDKCGVVNVLIEKILVFPDKVEILWKV